MLRSWPCSLARGSLFAFPSLLYAHFGTFDHDIFTKTQLHKIYLIHGYAFFVATLDECNNSIFYDFGLNWVTLCHRKRSMANLPHRQHQTDEAKIVSWVTRPIRSFRWSCRTCKIKGDRSKRPPGCARWRSLRYLS